MLSFGGINRTRKIDPRQTEKINRDRLPDNATREDMRVLDERLDKKIVSIEKNIQQIADDKKKEEIAPTANGLRAIKMLGKGFADIGKSINTPESNKRPKIAQMPGRRSQIGISMGMNLEFMKPKHFRGKTLRGNY